MDVATGPRAGRREWFGLAVLALPTLLASLELTIPNLALPAIGKDLDLSGTQQLWIVDVYGFVLAGSLITMGTLGDRVGRRRLLMAGSAAFGLASLLAAYATSAEMLIAARALLGVAGATLMPSTLALATGMFRDPRQRTTAIGVIVSCVSGGTVLGPLLGGWVLDRFWWGAAFLLAVPVMVVLIAIIPMVLPEHRNPAAGRLDPLSAALSLAAVLAVVYGLKQVAVHGFGWPALASVAAGLAVGAMFVRRQRTLADPLLDLRLFARPAFVAALGTLLLGIFVLFGANFYIAQYLQLVHGLSPLAAGLWTAPSAGGVIVGSTLAPWLVRRAAPGYVIAAGMLISAAGFGALARVGADSGGLALLVTAAVIISLGLGPMMTLATDLAVGSVPPERIGGASALAQTAPELGGALGIAVLGSIGTAVYRGEIRDALPGGLPPEAARGGDTLAGAAEAAATLPAALAAQILDTARDAFTHGLHVSAAVSAAILLGTALLAAALLRDKHHPISPPSDPSETGPPETGPPETGPPETGPPETGTPTGELPRR